MELTFKQAGKYSMASIAVVGVLGLLKIFFSEGAFGLGARDAWTEMSHDFGRLNTSRMFLIAWETFWLTSIAVFFFYVAKRAKSGKSEDQIENLEGFEPLLFKVVIGGLILAALLTLLLPVFVGENFLPHYNQNDTGTEVEVIANQFSFRIDGTFCSPSTDAAASCATFETGVRYVFLLQSTDTTHGFTIYDEDYVLLMQAQIVPDYVTRLAFTFDTPGDYSIRCAEYCGAGHQIMQAAFTVVEGGS